MTKTLDELKSDRREIEERIAQLRAQLTTLCRHGDYKSVQFYTVKSRILSLQDDYAFINHQIATAIKPHP